MAESFMLAILRGCPKALQNKLLNMFKVNSKDTRTTPIASFWYIYF